MMCLACGAEMHLMQMDQRSDLRSPIAFERHTFKCSVCPQLSQRLVFSRPSLPDLPAATRPRYPLVAKPQMRGPVAQNTLAKVAEKLRSRRMVTQARASAAMAPIWQETFEKLQDRATPIQEWAQAPETRSVQRLRGTRAVLNPSGTRPLRVYSNGVNPVVLPPGRAKLSTNPAPTGSTIPTNTIGTVRFVCWSAPIAALAEARMTSGASPTTSAAYRRLLSASNAPQRTSIRALRPSVQPHSCSP
jgi:hypothetical protein